MNVEFPMPPALQFLRSLLTRDSDSDSDNEEGDKKEGKKDDKDDKDEAGASNVESSKSTAAEGSKSDDEESMSTDKNEDRPLFGRGKKTTRKPGNTESTSLTTSYHKTSSDPPNMRHPGA